jgi:hypothetical protein
VSFLCEIDLEGPQHRSRLRSSLIGASTFLDRERFFSCANVEICSRDLRVYENDCRGIRGRILVSRHFAVALSRFRAGERGVVAASRRPMTPCSLAIRARAAVRTAAIPPTTPAPHRHAIAPAHELALPRSPVYVYMGCRRLTFRPESGLSSYRRRGVDCVSD